MRSANSERLTRRLSTQSKRVLKHMKFKHVPIEYECSIFMCNHWQAHLMQQTAQH